jgi:hypothetical protein
MILSMSPIIHAALDTPSGRVDAVGIKSLDFRRLTGRVTA